jgi:hypothetical protein
MLDIDLRDERTIHLLEGHKYDWGDPDSRFDTVATTTFAVLRCVVCGDVDPRYT